MIAKQRVRRVTVCASAAGVLALALLSSGCTFDARSLDASPGMIDGPIATPDGAPDGLVDAPRAFADARPDAVTRPDGQPDARTLPDAPTVFDAPPPRPDAPPVTHTLRHTYSFLTDAETFRANASQGMAMSYRADDGAPAGALSFTAIQTGTLDAVSAAFTWEDWGVPHGARVVSIGIASYERRLAADADMQHSWACELNGSDLQPVYDGLDGAYLELTNLTTTAQPTWEKVTGLPTFDVKPAYQASGTVLQTNLWWFTMQPGAIDWRLDEIAIDVVYVMPTVN